MTNDPIGDFLVRLQNASRVGKERVLVPYSSMKEALADVLLAEGYILGVERMPAGPLVVKLRYSAARPAISGSRRISKPSRRLYAGMHDIRPVRHGHGLIVLSTPKGLMTGAAARKAHVGGELLFEIW